jgi:hypothetical protein
VTVLFRCFVSVSITHRNERTNDDGIVNDVDDFRASKDMNFFFFFVVVVVVATNNKQQEKETTTTTTATMWWKWLVVKEDGVATR